MPRDITPGYDRGLLVAVLALVGAVVMIVVAALWGAIGNMPF